MRSYWSFLHVPSCIFLYDLLVLLHNLSLREDSELSLFCDCSVMESRGKVRSVSN